MAIHFLDSTDFERPFFTQIHTKSPDIASAIIIPLDDVRNFTYKHASASCTIFNLYRLIQHHRSINHLLDSHLFSLV